MSRRQHFFSTAAAAAFLLVSFLPHVASEKAKDGDVLYLLNNNNESPGQAELLQYNVASNTTTSISKSIDGTFEGLSDSAVCGDYFYFFGVNAPVSWSLVQVHLSSGNVSYLSQESPFLFHRLTCDKRADGDASKLLAVISTMPAPVDFHYVSYDPVADNITTLGSFPDGVHFEYDTEFTFSFELNQLWGTFLKLSKEGKPEGSSLYKMGLSDGQVEGPYKFEFFTENRAPIQLFPQAESFKGIAGDYINHHLALCNFKVEEEKVSESGCKTVNAYPNNAIPSPLCGNTFYFFTDNANHQAGADQKLYSIDIESGDETLIADAKSFVDKPFFGAAAGVGCI